MKRIFLFALITASLVGISFRPAAGSLPIGAEIPKASLKLRDISGKDISLQDQLKQNGLLVMFSCNTCPVVRGYQSRTKMICTYAAETKLGVVLLNSNEAFRNDSESLDAMKSYMSAQDLNCIYAIDRNSELADAFGASRTPECFVFNPAGKLVYKGAIDDNPGDAGGVKKEHLKNAIDEMVAGKDVTVKETRSVGCSIKRNS